MNQTAKYILHGSVKTRKFGILKAVQLEKLADIVETKSSAAKFPEFARSRLRPGEYRPDQGAPGEPIGDRPLGSMEPPA
jgi:hypothetical protein